MGLKDHIPEEALDMTHEELKESDEVDWEDETTTEEEFREDVGDMHQAFEIYAGMMIINKMFDDGHITLGEYLDIMEVVKKYQKETSVNFL